MAAVPAFLLVHTMVVEPYLGQAGAKPTYGAGVTVACFAADKRRKVRNELGEQIISETTVVCPLSTNVPPKSRVTINGRTAYVITTSRGDGGGLPTPDHQEVLLT